MECGEKADKGQMEMADCLPQVCKAVVCFLCGIRTFNQVAIAQGSISLATGQHWVSYVNLAPLHGVGQSCTLTA